MCTLLQGAGNEAEENSKATEKVLEIGSDEAAFEKPVDPDFTGVEV
jgi:hypothetical protein